MPTFGLRGVTVAEYHKTGGVVTYGTPISAGCAISVNLELLFAEARLYACDSLAEYLRECIGGNATFGAKYLPQAAQQLLFGSSVKTRSVTYTDPATDTATTKTVTSVVTSGNDSAPYVGFSGYAPDLIDGVRQWTAFVVAKVKFSPPSLLLQTKGQTITFQTPQTVGAFMPDDTSGKVIQEVAICDSEAEAKAWCTAVFPQASQNAQAPAAGSGESGGETTGG